MQGRLMQFLFSVLIIGGGGVVVWSAISAIGSGELMLKSEYSTLYRADSPIAFWIALAVLLIFGLGIMAVGLMLLFTKPKSKDTDA